MEFRGSGSTQQVLVPRIYLRTQPGDLLTSGALIVGNQVNLNIQRPPGATGVGPNTPGPGTLTNSGAIAGRSVVEINADNLNLLGGSIEAGGRLDLHAREDLTLSSALENRTLKDDWSNTVKKTMVSRVAGLYVTNPNGLMQVISDGKINGVRHDIGRHLMPSP